MITARDIKGTNRVKDDWQLLCDKKAFVLGDPVAAVVADTKEQALAAAEKGGRRLRTVARGFDN